MPDVPIVNRTTTAAPKDYTLPQSQEILLKAVRAEFDGTGAATSFLPALQLVSDAGDVMFTAVLTSTSVAAGGSASVSWFPLKKLTAGSPAPSPNPLGTLWGWWDFSDTTTITLDGSSKIQTIKDKTGNGHDLSQGTAANRPAESTLNGLNCGIFNSAHPDVLTGGSWTPNLAQPFTVAIVYTQSVGGANNYLPGPFGGPTVVAEPVIFENNLGSSVNAQVGSSSISTALASPFTQQLVVVIYDGASSHLRLNSADKLGTVDGNAMTDTALGASHFPARPPLVEQLDGKIGECLVYSGHLTAAQLSAVESYLKTKWATP